MGNKRISKITIIGFIFFIFVFAIVFIVMTTLRGGSFLAEIETEEDAQAELTKILEHVTITESDLKKASVSLEANNLAAEVPDISEYGLSVQGENDVDLEIFATSEKAGNGRDGWLNEVAENFNKEKNTISGGQTVSVSIRPMSSGLGADYIISDTYLPDAYTPSNELFGKLVQAQGGTLNEVCKKLAGNAAGILLSKKMKEKVEKNYGEVTVETVCEATADGVLTMGYTNPLTSAAGLNFLVSALYAYGGEDLLGGAAKEGFTSFQENVPYVAYTTLQMRDSAKSGSLNGMVMEYQLYINDSDLKSDYTFVPFGVPHNNPLYAVGDLSDAKQEALELFVAFCQNVDSKKLAEKYGFDKLDYEEKIPCSGADILGAQKLWKANKDSGRDILAVFVADVSGSMAGEPLNSLKSSLTNAASYINENNYVGLVSYSDDVAIELPLGKFDLNQRSYFQGAVEGLSPNGGTASYDAVCTAVKMLNEAKKDHKDAKQMIFLLSDGAVNTGASAARISPLMKYYKIPIYTIAYGDDADTDELQSVSSINEAACISASSDDVIYQLKQLFNAQM